MHQHRPSSTMMRPFAGPIAGAKRNPSAHGGYTIVAHCACGAIREENRNQGAVERGPWFTTEEN